ncbi:hypothetical protein GQ53DRAFT_54126 [Thozetella sp. PMI_491]|nr:hypothetical protein GQ53DRAFT_54126 [Thozetella sp. PMI_491]
MSAQRVPAWKRLGLKLKGAASDDSPALSTNVTPNPKSRPNAANTAGSPATNGTSNKRNLTPSAYSSPSHSSPYQPANKRLRTGDRSFGTARDTSHPRNTKSVSFASGTKDSSTNSPHDTKKSAKNKPKKKKKPKASAEPTPEFDLTPTLSYLRQWATARDAWKFNKNHQTLLIKYIFDGAPRVPSADLNAFLNYICDLKGGVRNRLRETATEIRKKDMDDGAAGFAADMPEKEAKQRRYEEVIGRFLQEQKDARQSRTTNGPAHSPNKRSFDEVEFVLRTAEPDLKQRLIKRIRAELVLEELSDSEESTSSGQTTTTASTQDGAVADNEMDVDEKPANGSQPNAKRRRIRNLRTGNTEVNSSSESESGSDSDEASDDDGSSSESSSEDESDDEEMAEPNDVESSSSSSSSEGEESESGSDGDSDDD